jgi:hypothetical protein
MGKQRSLLDHLENRELGRRIDNFDWLASSRFVADDKPLDLHYTTRYRLELRSFVEYDIPNADRFADRADHPAHRNAKARLVNHVYQDQVEIGHKLFSGLYGGATRQELTAIVNELLESMRYDDGRYSSPPIR